MSRSVTRVKPFSVLALGTFHDYVTEQYYVFVKVITRHYDLN